MHLSISINTIGANLTLEPTNVFSLDIPPLKKGTSAIPLLPKNSMSSKMSHFLKIRRFPQKITFKGGTYKTMIFGFKKFLELNLVL